MEEEDQVEVVDMVEDMVEEVIEEVDGVCACYHYLTYSSSFNYLSDSHHLICDLFVSLCLMETFPDCVCRYHLIC